VNFGISPNFQRETPLDLRFSSWAKCLKMRTEDSGLAKINRLR